MKHLLDTLSYPLNSIQFRYKNLCFALAVLALVPVTTFSQKNFAPIGATWHYEGHELDCNGNHINYIVEKEVSIDEKNCSIIYAYTSNNIQSEFIDTNDSLIVWENENKIYFLEDTTFYLLFDFTVEIGDTVTYYSPINRGVFTNGINDNPELGPLDYAILITEIETIKLSNQELKVFHYDGILTDNRTCFNASVIIESIGSTSQDFTGDHTCYVADGCFGGLQCYADNAIEYKSDRTFETTHPACSLDSSHEYTDNTRFTLYPNPFNDIIYIMSSQRWKKAKLYQQDMSLVNTYQSAEYLNLSDLKQGVYILEIVTEKSNTFHRIIKQ